jgi:hypothetical protein
MTPEQAAAYVHAQSVAALAEIEAMKAANQHREMQGYTQAYGEEAFLEVVDKYRIGHNAVVETFNEANELARRS